MIGFPRHKATVTVNGTTIEGWTSYEITSSMNDGANHFTMAMPFTLEAWELCEPDSPVRVAIDGVPIITGYIDERLINESNGDTLQIFGRDKVGRLVQESAPTLDFRGLRADELIAKVVKPWFPKVLLTNEANRTVQLGRGKKAKSAAKLTTISGDVPKVRVEPGQSRWEVIEQICDQTGLLARSSADGSALIVAKPNYDQEANFRLFMPSVGSKNGAESTLIGLGVRDSVAERYSRIIVVGSGAGTGVSYGAEVAARFGEAKNNPNTVDGEGMHFQFPKRLVILRSVHSIEKAREMARREMARRDAQGRTLTAMAPGHGQLVAGSFVTMFAPDTMAHVIDERTKTNGAYLITSCAYRSSRADGETTTMSLVRKGAELSL